MHKQNTYLLITYKVIICECKNSNNIKLIMLKIYKFFHKQLNIARLSLRFVNFLNLARFHLFPLHLIVIYLKYLNFLATLSFILVTSNNISRLDLTFELLIKTHIFFYKYHLSLKFKKLVLIFTQFRVNRGAARKYAKICSSENYYEYVNWLVGIARQ